VNRKSKIRLLVVFLSCIQITTSGRDRLKNTVLDFYNDPVSLSLDNTGFVDFPAHLSEAAVLDFYKQMETSRYDEVVSTLTKYREEKQPDDWIYYQLIRKTAQSISPKQENYIRYTLYKWFFLMKSGYDAQISVTGDTILLYVQCDENIYDIPYHMRNGKQYVCLNYHDYGYNLDFAKLAIHRIPVNIEGGGPFSYKLTHVPQFKPSDYKEKDVRFNYQDVSYNFRLRVNEKVKDLYNNYPVVDYSLYFNVPMSGETYNSLVPGLREVTAGMSMKNGIDYLMQFTRYAFIYQTDQTNFGKEKRLSPEQTLLYDRSDCEDRSALFFFLVKEIYNLPMIVLAYPTHVTVAVKLDKVPGGRPIIYNGDKYYICEPTPQWRDLRMGEISRELKAETYEVAYAYNP
jgi:hypothetical protein